MNLDFFPCFAAGRTCRKPETSVVYEEKQLGLGSLSFDSARFKRLSENTDWGHTVY